MDNVDLKNAKLGKNSRRNVARRSEGKNGHTKSKGNMKVLALVSPSSIQTLCYLMRIKEVLVRLIMANSTLLTIDYTEC